MHACVISFVSLLDYAEAQLCCADVQILFSTNLSDCKRRQLIQVFNLVGFELISPLSPDLPSPEYTFMRYTFSPESSDEDD